MMINDDSHPSFPRLPDDLPLWRYMDLPKFVSLLEDGALHFARADLMTDRWEGAFGEANVRLRPSLYGEHYPKMFPRMGELFQFSRARTYLSCWCSSEFESAAMWDLYQHDGRGIAIRTTLGALGASVSTPWMIYAGSVTYVDYRTTYIPERHTFDPLLRKRMSFEHEHEVRLMTMASEDRSAEGAPYFEAGTAPPDGVKVPVDLAALAESIYVAPTAPSWYVDIVEKLISRYNLQWQVHHSDLDNDPIW